MDPFEKNIISTYREKGRDWLAELPEQVLHFKALWELSHLKPCDNLSHNYVLSGYQKEKPIILKLSPDPLSLNNEALALKAFAGYGAVSILNYQDNALLLQRAMPGNHLKNHLHKDSQKRLQIACSVMKKLHSAPLSKESNFPHIEDWLSTLDKQWPIPKDHLEKARMLKKQLLQTVASPILLHGDLHQDNILSSGEDWLVIDPKGVIGYPSNEIGPLVEKPDHDLKYISEYLNLNFDDAVKWYYVHLVLAACWRIEDNLDPKHFLDSAHAALSLIKE